MSVYDNDGVSYLDGCEMCGRKSSVPYTEGVGFHCGDCLNEHGVIERNHTAWEPHQPEIETKTLDDMSEDEMWKVIEKDGEYVDTYIPGYTGFVFAVGESCALMQRDIETDYLIKLPPFLKNLDDALLYIDILEKTYSAGVASASKNEST